MFLLFHDWPPTEVVDRAIKSEHDELGRAVAHQAARHGGAAASAFRQLAPLRIALGRLFALAVPAAAAGTTGATARTIVPAAGIVGASAGATGANAENANATATCANTTALANNLSGRGKLAGSFLIVADRRSNVGVVDVGFHPTGARLLILYAVVSEILELVVDGILPVHIVEPVAAPAILYERRVNQRSSPKLLKHFGASAFAALWFCNLKLVHNSFYYVLHKS